jgi:hypothetical protein
MWPRNRGSSGGNGTASYTPAERIGILSWELDCRAERESILAEAKRDGTDDKP